MTKLRELDSQIILKLQEAYLWLYDRSGVYVATCMMVSIFIGIGALTLNDGKMDFLRIFVVILNLVVVIPNYWMQEKQEFTQFNFIAMMLHQSMFRFGFVYFWCFPMFMLDMLLMKWAWGINQVAVIVFLYLSCIMIREREPKDWITKHKLATEST